MASEGEALSDLVRMARFLRSDEGCPWDRAQDEASLAQCVLSEAHELQEAVASGDAAHIREEIGDVLFALIGVAVVMEEKGATHLIDIFTELQGKMVRRHPHVFGKESAATVEEALWHWNQAKRSEKTGRP